jgi:hypothetical protein
MAEIYRAVFTCPELDERAVWYVSNRRAADIMLSRHIRTPASANIASKYKRVEYKMTVEPVFTGTGDAGYDPTI